MKIKSILDMFSNKITNLGAPSNDGDASNKKYVDDGLALKSNTAHTHTSSEVGLGNVQNYGITSQVDAELGETNNSYMTPLRTRQAIEAIGGGGSSHPNLTLTSLNLGNYTLQYNEVSDTLDFNYSD